MRGPMSLLDRSPMISVPAVPAGAPTAVMQPARNVTQQDVAVAQTAPWRTTAVLLAGDTLAVAFVMYVVYVASLWVMPSLADSVMHATPWVVAGMLALYGSLGTYRTVVQHPVHELRFLFSLVAVCALGGAFLMYALTQEVGYTLLVAGGGVVAMAVLPVVRTMTRIVGAQLPWWGLPAVVVGAGDQAARITDTLRRWPEIGLRPVAVCTPLHGVHPEQASEAALQWAKRYQVSYAIIADTQGDGEQRARRFASYSQFFEHVFVVPPTQGMVAAWTTTPTCEGLYGFGIRHLQHQPVARFVKRTIDVVGALVLLFILFPVLTVLAGAVRMSSSGPVFYRQTRMGYQGRSFTVLKFRTMFTDADVRLDKLLSHDPVSRAEYERYHKLQNDPRVTAVGQWMRRYSLDELPQLINVLRGEMSLVGPRAYMPKELFQMRGMNRVVLQTPPGITGLWQVSGRNAVSFDVRIDLDIHYVHNWSPWLDLYVLARTVPVVCSGSGAH